MSNKTPEDREHQITIENGIAVFPSSEDRTIRDRSEKEARDEQRKEEQHGFNARQTAILERQERDGSQMVSLTFGLLLISIATAGVSCYQAKVGNESAEAAITSARVAEETLKDSRIAAKESERRMDELADGMKKSVNAFILQAENSRRMTDTVKDQAQRFFNENSKNLLDQKRAWVGFSEISGPIYPSASGNVYVEEGKPLTYKLTFKNFGQTPAFRVRLTQRYEGVFKGGMLRPIEVKLDGSESIIPPESTTSAIRGVQTGEHPFTKEEIAVIVAGQVRIYIIAALHYYDIANRKHETRVCKYLLPDLKYMVDCPSGNSID